MFSSKTRHLIIILFSLGLSVYSARIMPYTGWSMILRSIGWFWLSWLVLTLASGIILGLMGIDLRRRP
jgi:hypothetical protein